MVDPIPGMVLFREDKCLKDNLVNLLNDLYHFQEPCRDNTPWIYFMVRTSISFFGFT